MPPRPTRSSPPRPIPGKGLREDEVELGYVSGFFGYAGEVRLHLHNRASALVGDRWRVVLVAPDGRRFEASLSARPGAGKRVIGKLDGVDAREAGEAFKDHRIAVAAADLPATGEGEYYVWQLRGLEVVVGGRRRGVVADVHHTPAGDLLEIDVDGGEPEFVPALAELVEDVDLGAGRVTLSPGAFDEGEE